MVEKRIKRSAKREEPTPRTDLTFTEPTTVRELPTRPLRRAPSLADVRARALHSQTETAQTIADLEAWRAEIDCTLAFLRAAK